MSCRQLPSADDERRLQTEADGQQAWLGEKAN
jgi:hypothetical protein